MPADLSDILWIAGRALLGALFVIGGAKHFPVFDVIAEAMRNRGVPFPRTALLAGTLFQMVAGAALIVGLYPTAAALGLVAFTLAATAMMLNFWDKQGEERDAAFAGFMSNAAVVGGLLVAAAHAA